MPDQPSDESAQEKAKDLINQAFGREKKDDRSFVERIKDQVAAAAEDAQEKAEQKNDQEERREALLEQQKARAEEQKERAAERAEQQRATQQSQSAGASIQESIAAAARQAAENAAKARAQNAPAAPASDTEELEALRQRVAELEKPAAPAPAAAAPEPRTYTVKGGDSLSKIAKNFYGDAMQWKRIYEANRDKISNPDLIHPGQVFVIPE